MDRIVPRLVCERFGRYVIVRRYDKRLVMFWSGIRWTRSQRSARLYHDMRDVNEVIARFQPPSFWD